MKAGYYPCFSWEHLSWYCRDIKSKEDKIEVYVLWTNIDEHGALEAMPNYPFTVNIDDRGRRVYDMFDPRPAVEKSWKR